MSVKIVPTGVEGGLSNWFEQLLRIQGFGFIVYFHGTHNQGSEMMGF